MKYFTPELFCKLQECASPDDFRRVNAEWELAVERYGKQLQELTPRMKGALQRFVKRGSLHDSRVLDIGTTKRTATIIVQEQRVPRLLTLRYSLVAAPLINRTALTEDACTPYVSWLYDELAVDSEMLFHLKRRIEEKSAIVAASAEDREAWQPIFIHAILLSNGWEIHLRFHSLADTRTTSLLRPGASVHRDDDSLSCSA